MEFNQNTKILLLLLTGFTFLFIINFNEKILISRPNNDVTTYAARMHLNTNDQEEEEEEEEIIIKKNSLRREDMEHYYDDDVVDEEEETSSSLSIKNNSMIMELNGNHPQLPPKQTKQQLSLKEIKDLVSTSKNDLISELKEEFGEEFYDRVFQRELSLSASSSSISNNIVDVTEFSKSMLIKRLAYKIVQSQLFSEKITKFTWATAGHSSAAGHGNLMWQSYTARLEATARSVFHPLGILFVGKNYAMGNQRSGPELAMCLEAVYGPDIDVLSWDFSMTDGTDSGIRLDMWASKAFHHPTRPLLALIDGSKGRNIDHLRYFEKDQFQMGSFLMRLVDLQKIIKDTLPDAVKDDPAKNDALPPALQNFICGGKIEEGECRSAKYDVESVCPPGTRDFQTSWHPGWKMNNLIGRIIGFMLADSLSLAVDWLVERVDNDNNIDNPNIWKALEPQVRLFEETSFDLDNTNYYHNNKNNTMMYPSAPPKIDGGDSSSSDEDLNSVFLDFIQRRPVCRIATRPAYTRYQGYLTPDYNKTSSSLLDFDPGISLKDAMEADPLKESTAMPLVYDPGEIKQCKELLIDFHDFFLVRGKDEALSFVIPNPLELNHFTTKQVFVKQNHMIMVTGLACPWDKCPNGMVDVASILNHESNIEITVNGVPVAGLQQNVVGSQYGKTNLLTHNSNNEDGGVSVYWQTNEEGVYDIRVKLKGDDHVFMKITSVIII